MTTSITKLSIVTFVGMLMLGSFCLISQAAAQELTTKTTTNDYYSLKAKVAYLTAWIEALRTGEPTPPPTYITILDGATVSVVGTLAQHPKPDAAEICGPMTKGSLDWGDGTVGRIVGLGCAGDASTFEAQHIYTESGSYAIKITDVEGRRKTHIVAVNVTN